MDARQQEILVTISEGERKYCTVCKTFAYEGEFIQNRANKHTGRHVGCVPKRPYQPPPKGVIEKPRSTSSQRRRAGGHGYTGGDGWIDL